MHDDPATDLLDAAYRALCRHGYADLTLRDVAAEATRSKASIHYHYDDRDSLFAALLDHLREAVAAGVETGSFTGSVDPDAAADALVTAATGVHARSTATDRSRERLTEATLAYAETRLAAGDPAEAGRR